MKSQSISPKLASGAAGLAPEKPKLDRKVWRGKRLKRVGRSLGVRDLTGLVFGRWTVVKYNRSPGFWECQCSCGTIRNVFSGNLWNNVTKSCGCYKLEIASQRLTIHGKTGSHDFTVWQNMKGRCTNPKSTHYARYGGRGIKVCARWMCSFVHFMEDMGPRPDGFTIERLDVNGDYKPENCIWANWETQANNKSNSRRIELNGKTQTLSQWAKDIGMMPLTLRARLERGMSLLEAISVPMRYKNCKQPIYPIPE